jgi:hypothetical protein
MRRVKGELMSRFQLPLTSSPVGDTARAQRFERQLAGVMATADHQQVLARAPRFWRNMRGLFAARSRLALALFASSQNCASAYTGLPCMRT